MNFKNCHIVKSWTLGTMRNYRNKAGGVVGTVPYESIAGGMVGAVP